RIGWHAAHVAATSNGKAFIRSRQIIVDFFRQLINRAKAGDLTILNEQLLHFGSTLVQHETSARRNLVCASAGLVPCVWCHSHKRQVNPRRKYGFTITKAANRGPTHQLLHCSRAAVFSPLVAPDAQVKLWPQSDETPDNFLLYRHVGGDQAYVAGKLFTIS